MLDKAKAASEQHEDGEIEEGEETLKSTKQDGPLGMDDDEDNNDEFKEELESIMAEQNSKCCKTQTQIETEKIKETAPPVNAPSKKLNGLSPIEFEQLKKKQKEKLTASDANFELNLINSLKNGTSKDGLKEAEALKAQLFKSPSRSMHLSQQIVNQVAFSEDQMQQNASSIAATTSSVGDQIQYVDGRPRLIVSIELDLLKLMNMNQFGSQMAEQFTGQGFENEPMELSEDKLSFKSKPSESKDKEKEREKEREKEKEKEKQREKDKEKEREREKKSSSSDPKSKDSHKSDSSSKSKPSLSSSNNTTTNNRPKAKADSSLNESKSGKSETTSSVSSSSLHRKRSSMSFNNDDDLSSISSKKQKLSGSSSSSSDKNSLRSSTQSPLPSNQDSKAATKTASSAKGSDNGQAKTNGGVKMNAKSSSGGLLLADGQKRGCCLDFLESTLEEQEFHKRGKQKKHEADIEKDKIKKTILYMEAVCNFCLCAICQYRLKKTSSTSQSSTAFDLLKGTYDMLRYLNEQLIKKIDNEEFVKKFKILS